MDNAYLIASTVLAAVAAIAGILSVHRGHRSRWTVLWMLAVFAFQLMFLAERGQLRKACPLMDSGEILNFLAWSLTLFYLLIGPVYRISLMGVFTAPVVTVLQLMAMIPGKMDANPQPVQNTNPWHETHSATSMLGYGALGLAAVTALMFLVLNHQLKGKDLRGELFKNLPPVPHLLISLKRLLWLGWALLTIGIIAGYLAPNPVPMHHFISGIAIWLAYAALIGTHRIRGLAGRTFSLATIVLFMVSLVLFVYI